jgi:hypothetical protein
MVDSAQETAEGTRPQQGGSAPGPDRVGQCIRERYIVEATIGKGGMAVVYRAKDLANGRSVALKQLTPSSDDRQYRQTAALFEREFHVLSQLSHPRIIEVYDFGVDEEHGPFYTMELLDGGDLRERCPLPWKEACSVAYDICSSLALLHSRRLVHRDVSPRNVRCTHDGTAKLIDFGAMVPMGAGSVIVGTPLFTAPEVVLRSYLDARTDLFSLGATIYYALTGRAPYPARDMVEAAAAWKVKPRPPSFNTDCPEGLDALVLSLVGIDPATRPRTAFEVMQRLSVVAGLSRIESVQVSRAYLSTPNLVGRDETMAHISNAMKWAQAGHGRSVLVEGPAGIGRSRLLDACSLVAETLGAGVLRARGGALGQRAFGTAEHLAQKLVEDSPDTAVRLARDEDVFDVLFEEATPRDGELAAPRLRDFRTTKAARYALQTALCRWLLRCSDDRPLAVAVDDLHNVDEPSLALLAALSTQIEGRRLIVIATAETGAEPADRLAFDVFGKHAARVALGPLAASDSERLFESVFGDVPNLRVVSDGIHAIASGNPRTAMDLAQHLVDRGTIRYERGNWTLPTRLDPSDLPRDAGDAIRARIGGLSPLARWLAEAQSLATYRVFGREDYGMLRPGATPGEVDGAIDELVSERVVTSDGQVFSLAHNGYTAALHAGLSEEDQVQRHRALVSLYEGKLPLGVVRHALFGGLEARALDELAPILPDLAERANLYELTDLGALEVAATFERALGAAERLGRSPIELNHLRRWLASLSVASDDKYYFRVAPEWLAQLKHDAGLTAWERFEGMAPEERLSRAMQSAYAEYAATPEAERVYRPDEAVKNLAHFAGISLAIGSSRLELSITESLPALLEPFAPVSPLVGAIWQNVLAARESSCRSRWESGRDGWIDVYERLTALYDSDPAFISVFQRAVAYAIATNEATMGMSTAEKWAGLLDDDPAQRVNALYIRRIARLGHGDLDGAERFRRQAEVLALQARARQMFSHLLWVELVVCGMARDLTGVKQCEDRLRANSVRSPGWVPYVRLAEGTFCLCCDDFAGARAAFQDVQTATSRPLDDPWPRPTAWCLSAAGLVEALVGLGEDDEARRTGEDALATCMALDIDVASHGISRALSLAEARTGDAAAAASRLDRIAQRQTELGITGVHLGATYEARARVAIVAGDRDGFERYALLTAREYRHGRGSPLGARYERLADEGLRAVRGSLPNLAEFDSAALQPTATPGSLEHYRSLVGDVKDTPSMVDRAARALEVLCREASCTAGHLYFFDGKELEHAAAFNAGPPPHGLGGFVSTHLSRRADDEAPTMVFAEDGPSPEAFVDGDGTRYVPLVLTAFAPEKEHRAVVAALVVSGEAPAVRQELSAAITAFLAGEVSAVERRTAE